MSEGESQPEVTLAKSECEFCPETDVPLCYAKFFTNGEGQPKKTGNNNKKQDQKQNILIKIKNRRARKFLTTITNIESWNLNLKELQKLITKKLSSSCSVKKQNGQTEVVIQGDARDVVTEILTKQFQIPKKNIEVVVKKPKVKKEKQPPPQDGGEPVESESSSSEYE